MSGQPTSYYPISRFYQERFGGKVYKISVAVAETCPNREGLKGMKTCTFCDQWGSAAYAENLVKPLSQQIEEVREVLRRKRGADRFLVYFQAYTTTFGKVSRLREQVELALSYSDVVGVVIGTRPDCVSQAFLDFVDELSQRTFVAVEMGVQSFDEKTLMWLSRGHSAEQAVQSIERIAAKAPSVNLGVHLIFGCPNESDEWLIKTAEVCNRLPVHNVKLHHLHVLRGTELENLYADGHFQPVEREEYFRRCGIFLRHLRPNMAVHRLAAFSPRADELIAPAWSAYKMETYQLMLDYLKENQIEQGQLYT